MALRLAVARCSQRPTVLLRSGPSSGRSNYVAARRTRGRIQQSDVRNDLQGARSITAFSAIESNITDVEFFSDAHGALLFSSSVPASPGDGSLSFFGILFKDARIARVRITSGNVAPEPDDGVKTRRRYDG